MKAFMWVLMIAVVVAMPLSAWAQDDWVFLADAEAGLAVDGPDMFTDRYSPVGYGAGLGIGAILSPDVMLLVYFSYTYLPIDETGFSNDSSKSPYCSFERSHPYVDDSHRITSSFIFQPPVPFRCTLSKAPLVRIEVHCDKSLNESTEVPVNSVQT